MMHGPTNIKFGSNMFTIETTNGLGTTGVGASVSITRELVC